MALAYTATSPPTSVNPPTRVLDASLGVGQIGLFHLIIGLFGTLGPAPLQWWRVVVRVGGFVGGGNTSVELDWTGLEGPVGAQTEVGGFDAIEFCGKQEGQRKVIKRGMMPVIRNVESGLKIGSSHIYAQGKNISM